ncbi:MAG: carboxylating nicotinate-nucleotide diphosphorylase [Helicobacteraceae bacterium]|jgi:nicotinate-nucleotide pyrophosphorylase (carboxylating)|nr:carboxylating nicotinate-nucleotide diphosphorylase [Helicobacteraceae bacterium]
MERISDFAHSILSEDIGRGDLFERCKTASEACAALIAKSEGLFAGRYYAEAIAKAMGLEMSLFVDDGEVIAPNQRIAELRGSDTAILKTERTLLNLLQHASGIATQTRRFVDRLEGSGVTLLDTRKTRPLLRRLEKYAVRVGGGVNHRFGLDDCLMIKDTHLARIDDLAAFVSKARKVIPWTATIEVECETFETAAQAFEARVDIVMCDNMPLDLIRQVVVLRDKIAPSIKIEASGNITLETIAQYAQTGVDAISTGSLIHHAVWLDFSMKMLK